MLQCNSGEPVSLKTAERCDNLSEAAGPIFALVAELADAAVSKAAAERLVGSSPTGSTNKATLNTAERDKPLGKRWAMFGAGLEVVASGRACSSLHFRDVAKR